jgi:C-terminal processing protease CtpA/Prc
LGRAVIVGERTGGGAHPFKYRQVDSRFVLSLAEGRSVNPVTGGNWQGVGVQPDVPVPADAALQKAHELARAAVAKPNAAPVR